MSTAFFTIIESIPGWIRLALVKTVAGVALAFVTATLLLAVGKSSLQDVGQDLGLRAKLYLERVFFYDEPWRQETSAPSFVFLDVDPEQAAGSGGQAACAALARAGRVPPVPALNCSSARPVNRYLLAALLGELVERKARMIILDVELGIEEGVIDPAENEALTDAFAAHDNTIPLLLVQPLVGSTQAAPDGLQRVTAYAPSLFGGDPARGIWKAAALPVPGQPLRRYPKCLWLTGPDAAYLPSLPYLAARLLADPALRDPCPVAGMEQRNADPHWDNDPRIVFSLAALDEHHAAGPVHSGDRAPETQSVYRHHLASHFWQADAPGRIGPGPFHNKVVVIGASSSLRRDRHYTPLGDMSGGEVVINAIRSFSMYPANRDLSLAELLLKKMRVVGWCSLVWFAYFLLRCRILPEARKPGPVAAAGPSRNSRAPLRSYLKVALAFLVAFLAACGVAIVKSYRAEGPVPSLDVLIPVLALAVDAYVEIVGAVVHRVENKVRQWLRLPVPSAHGGE